MPDKRVILVTGVAGYWGGRVAGVLMALPGLHVIGLDTQPLAATLRGLDFVQADLRNALLPELLQGEQVDTLVHLAFEESERPNEQAFDANVTGTIKLMGACAAAGVRKAVLCSSTAVYGARPDNSAFLSEDHALYGSQRWGTVRDLAEIEAFCNGFVRQTPAMAVTVLRLAGIVGPTADSALSRFLRATWTPVLLGFDPLMQVLHEEDAAGVIVHAVLNDAPGVYNIAAEGPLPLSQLMAVAGKIPLPVVHVGVYWGMELARAFGADLGRYVPIDPDYLRYPCVADLERMRLQLGFAPHYTALEALREFAGEQRLARFLPEQMARGQEEQRLRDTIERRRRARARAANRPLSAEDTVPENGHAAPDERRQADEQ